VIKIGQELVRIIYKRIQKLIHKIVKSLKVSITEASLRQSLKNLIFIFTTHFSSGYDPGEFEDIASD